MLKMEVPEYFICPISLQMMKDPVTVTSGITYDRHSIEQWLFANHNTICPVTKLPLLPAAPLTPNHTLRRLIRSWCALHTPAPLTKFHVITLIRGLSAPEARLSALRKLEAMALDSDRTRAYMVEAELPNKLMHFIVACCRRRDAATPGLVESLSILYIIRKPLLAASQPQSLPYSYSNHELVDSLTWIFDCDRFRNDQTVKSHAAHALKAIVRKANDPGILERLKPEFFQTAARNLREGGASCQEALLHVLLEACTCGRNRAMMVEYGTVFDLIEVELKCPEKKSTTEMVLGILYHLCLCADGRAQLLSHAAGIAVVTRRILEVSATADDRAVLIIWQISKYSATKGVLEEMLRVGTVANLCLVMLADSCTNLKERARKILRKHFDVWKDSPCIEISTLTRYST